MKLGSTEYEILRAWIACGAPGPRVNDPEVTGLVVTPTERIAVPHARQQLRVVATYNDGLSRDVTALSKFDSLDEGVLNASSDGLVTTNGKGQSSPFSSVSAVKAALCHVRRSVFRARFRSPAGRITEFCRRSGVGQVPRAGHRTFGPRVATRHSCAGPFLDAIGTAPPVEEARAFLASRDPAKRERLVDRLLGLTSDPKLDTFNDAYAAWWTLKWSDLLRNESNDLGEQGMWAFHNWILESFRSNKPFDRFVRELVTAKGSIYSVGPANFFRVNKQPVRPIAPEATAQLFLGVRLRCASSATIIRSRNMRPGRLLLVRLVLRPRRIEAEPGIRTLRPMNRWCWCTATRARWRIRRTGALPQAQAARLRPFARR